MQQKIIIGLPKITHCFKLKNYTTSNNHLTAVDELNESTFPNTTIHLNSLPNNNFTNFNNLIESSFANNPAITSIIHQNRRLTSDSSVINNNNSTSSNNTSNNNNSTSFNDTNTDFDKNKDNCLIASNENTACNTDNIFINDATATVATDLINYKNTLISNTNSLHKIHTKQELNTIIIHQQQTPTQVPTPLHPSSSSQAISNPETPSNATTHNNSIIPTDHILSNNNANLVSPVSPELGSIISETTLGTASTTSLGTTNNPPQTHNSMSGLHQAGPCNNNDCPICNPENSNSPNQQNISVDTEIKSAPDETCPFIENTYGSIAEIKLDPDSVTMHNQFHDMDTSFMQWNQLFQQYTYYRPIRQRTMTYDQFASLLTRLCEAIVQMNSQLGPLHSLNNAILEQINYDFGMQPRGSLDPEYVYHGASDHLRVLLDTYTTELAQYKQISEQFRYLYSQILNVWPSFHYHAFQNPNQLGHFLSMRMPSAHHHQALMNFISQMNQFNFNYTYFLTNLDAIYMTHINALQQTYHNTYAHLPFSNEHIINLIHSRLTSLYPFSLPNGYYNALHTIMNNQNNSLIPDHIFPNFHCLQNISNNIIANQNQITLYQPDILRALRNIVGPEHPIFVNPRLMEDIAARELFAHIPWSTHRSIRIQAENSWLFRETHENLTQHNIVPANVNPTGGLLQNLFTNFFVQVNSLPMLFFTILSFMWQCFVLYVFYMAYKEQASLYCTIAYYVALNLFDLAKKTLKTFFNSFINFFRKFF